MNSFFFPKSLYRDPNIEGGNLLQLLAKSDVKIDINGTLKAEHQNKQETPEGDGQQNPPGDAPLVPPIDNEPQNNTSPNQNNLPPENNTDTGTTENTQVGTEEPLVKSFADDLFLNQTTEVAGDNPQPTPGQEPPVFDYSSFADIGAKYQKEIKSADDLRNLVHSLENERNEVLAKYQEAQKKTETEDGLTRLVRELRQEGATAEEIAYALTADQNKDIYLRKQSVNVTLPDGSIVQQQAYVIPDDNLLMAYYSREYPQFSTEQIQEFLDVEFASPIKKAQHVADLRKSLTAEAEAESERFRQAISNKAQANTEIDVLLQKEKEQREKNDALIREAAAADKSKMLDIFRQPFDIGDGLKYDNGSSHLTILGSFTEKGVKALKEALSDSNAGPWEFFTKVVLMKEDGSLKENWPQILQNMIFQYAGDEYLQSGARQKVKDIRHKKLAGSVADTLAHQSQNMTANISTSNPDNTGKEPQKIISQRDFNQALENAKEIKLIQK